MIALDALFIVEIKGPVKFAMSYGNTIFWTVPHVWLALHLEVPGIVRATAPPFLSQAAVVSSPLAVRHFAFSLPEYPRSV